MTTTSKRSERRRQIAQWLERREREGLTYREIWARSGIPIPTLAWWKKKLECEATTAITGGLSPGLVEVRTEETGGDRLDEGGVGIVEVELAGGRRLRTSVTISPSTLAALVSALEGSC